MAEAYWGLTDVYFVPRSAAALELTLTGPELVRRQQYPAGSTIGFDNRDGAGSLLRDGSYRYRLRVTDPDGPAAVQVGIFRLENGVFVPPGE